MSSDCEQSKWICEYCTYRNYPSASKCTMCHGIKQLVIAEDIYSLTDDVPSRKTSGSSMKDDKWECDVCNYKNSVTSRECLQCNSLLDNNLTGVEDQLNRLNIGGNEILDESSVEKKNLNQKWLCSSCTYENWPKAKKCTMCLNPRPRSSPIPSTASGNSPERELSARNSEDNYTRSMKRSNGRRNEDVKSNSPNNNNNNNSNAANINNNNNIDSERRSRALKKLHRNADWTWLNACMGVYRGDAVPVIQYLSTGGDPTRQLTHNEIALLNRASAFDVGHTLVHIAIRFKREDILATLLSQLEGSNVGIKRVPSYVAPDLAADIRRHFASAIRQRKANFPCPYVNEHTTFYLPGEIDDLPLVIQEQLYEEILDRDVQQQLEHHIPPVINYWSHICSRLFALWNRSAGDCLLDSVMQGTWGVFDRENVLRRSLSEALSDSGRIFYGRWREYESIQATMLDFSLEETQWEEDWLGLLSLACQPGSSLEQLHVFVLSHILRRPIIIYGVKSVKSFRGEDIGFAKFEGVYLPLLWEPSFCIKTPLTLGYTRGHFSALVPLEPYTATVDSHLDSQTRVTFLPLMDYNHRLLPIHFVTQAEMGHEERLLRQWLDVFMTDTGLLIARQKLHKRPLLVAQMVEEWLNYYRRLAHMSKGPFTRPVIHQDSSSDGDTDDE